MTDADKITGSDEADEVIGWEIGHDEIRAARRSGAATSLSTIITDIVRYRGHWWIAHTSSWLRITDEQTSQRLDRHAEWANPRLLRDSP